MLCVGIDVAKDKHDCCVMDEDGVILIEPFSFRNSRDGFELFWNKVASACHDLSQIKVGLESTGHYSYNILGFLLDKGLTPFIINPLASNQFRKSLSLRKTKTDKVDALTICYMLNVHSTALTPYVYQSYHMEELKSLTRYRFDKVQQRAELKQSVSRLLTILFPELETLVSSIHLSSVYTLLLAYPGASYIADCHLTKLSNLLSKASRGRYGKDFARKLRDAARASVGSVMPAKSMELKHTIRLIRELTDEIAEIESAIKDIVDELDSPIMSVPGISYATGAMILAEIGDITRFSSPDKLLAYAGMSPSIYQSGKFVSSHAKMEKRGSKYLRWALFEATKHTCMWEPTFAAYLSKKRSEGKHYFVALSHAVKKLVRVIYHLETHHESYRPQPIQQPAA